QVCQVCAASIIVLVLLLVVLLGIQAWPAITHLGTSLVDSATWDPNYRAAEEGPTGRFGGLAFIYGSIVTSVLAMLLAVPLGVGTAAFLAEIASGLVKRTGSFLVELLAAIPSVVYGFWGINFLAPLVQDFFNYVGGPNTGGKGLLSASLILAIMVVPYVAAV